MKEDGQGAKPSKSTCQSSLTRSSQNGTTGWSLSEGKSGCYFDAVPYLPHNLRPDAPAGHARGTWDSTGPQNTQTTRLADTPAPASGTCRVGPPRPGHLPGQT